jgi:polyhydroxyalkanoate synthesis regulator phasin
MHGLRSLDSRQRVPTSAFLMSPSSSSDRSRSSSAAKRRKAPTSPKTGRGAAPSSVSRERDGSDKRASRAAASQIRSRGGVSDSVAALSEQLVDGILRPLGLVVLSRDRIAETVDEAAAQGRLTRHDAESLVVELVRRGRQQTDDLLVDLDRTLGRGREQLDVAARRARSAAPDRLIRHADRARRTIGVGPAFPILGYDDLTVVQVQRRMAHLSDPELRSVRDYERRNANRKSLLRAIAKALG